MANDNNKEGQNKESLHQLQQRYFQGDMGQDDYRQRRREWLDALLRGAAREEATVVQVHKPLKRRRWGLFALVLFVLAALGLWLARALWLPGP